MTSSKSSEEAAFLKAPGKQTFTNPPRVLVIGAGSRGTAYAKAALSSTNAIIAAVCEPIAYKRNEFGRKFIWGSDEGAVASHGSAFVDWREWVEYETSRREQEVKGGGEVGNRIDAVFVCVLDEMHEEVVCGIAGLKVHVCVEKPLSTRLESCMNIYRALEGDKAATDGYTNGTANGETNGVVKQKETIFGICHVLRYSPHNMLLRHLLLEKDVIGDVLSIEHVEPVGWWHFSHSYVRGNWRKESTTAPSLLTKSCHDIDFLMWLLCSPAPNAENAQPHLPSFITSTGSRKFFRKERKPKAAGSATNCLSCPHESSCDYSARKIYLAKHLEFGNTGWPVKIVNPEIEDIYKTSGKEAAAKQLLENLGEDYTSDTPPSEVEARPWFGRCVWEADNDVCDDQCVTITWDDDPIEKDDDGRPILKGRGAKTAQFHMVAFTEKICERRGRIYGTKGEIEYDSTTIKVHSFSTGYTKTHKPHMVGGGHGGGDEGLARQFLMAVNAVDSGTLSAADAQVKFLGCDLEEAFRSHAMVFAAEEARTQRQVVDWKKWWSERVESQLGQR
ncbi:streptomycin biosynthesis protein StrI [Cucurbitaria berberidis CBS 394.84]|uniref:Streptomycin biosynthesis protein StrI n=1 Tax=Cucurbitaria berberidis CBS 394.84 TaxID=1168544 RepID=A0A9P4GAK2_9PLEO|nr:streptomycin biosynthesis protein StrI [Cucurbitaria berberidis CBS 394.84]KAF1841994.1 streptomycin biosynthesis protein StrI [Cucurbitaria berberidis CBS 394.84]